MIRTIPIKIQIDGEDVELSCDVDFKIGRDDTLEVLHCNIEDFKPNSEQAWVIDEQAYQALANDFGNILSELDEAHGEASWEMQNER